MLARPLLRSDGVIVVSIDDNECHNLKMLLEEVFGPENFVAQIVVQSNPRGRQSERFVATVHEYLLVFAKNIEECVLSGAALTETQLKEYRHEDENENRYRLLGLRQRGSASRRQDRPKMFFPIYVNPQDGTVSLEKSANHPVEVLPRKSSGQDGRWMWGREMVQNEIGRLEARLIGSRGEWDIYVRDYLRLADGEERTRKFKTIWADKELNYQNGTQEIKELLGEGTFEFPKPMSLLRQILIMADDPDGLYMDFFAGSCTTAHAVMQLNRQDGGQRRFIMVQLPEPTGNKEFPTVAEIGKERLRRAIAKMNSDPRGSADVGSEETVDNLGFRALRLGHSNYRVWQDYDGSDVEVAETLFDRIETPLADDWNPQCLLTEVMLLQGFPLDSRLAPQTDFKKNMVVLVESGDCVHRLHVCLDKELADETINTLKLDREDIFVCLDRALTDEAKARLADVCNLNVI
ncbi:MAG: site-specific DNA-methyltransferase, partial [Terriglobia bacterium]